MVGDSNGGEWPRTDPTPGAQMQRGDDALAVQHSIVVNHIHGMRRVLGHTSGASFGVKLEDIPSGRLGSRCIGAIAKGANPSIGVALPQARGPAAWGRLLCSCRCTSSGEGCGRYVMAGSLASHGTSKDLP